MKVTCYHQKNLFRVYIGPGMKLIALLFNLLAFVSAQRDYYYGKGSVFNTNFKFSTLKFSFAHTFLGTFCCVDNAKEVNPATVMTAHAHKVVKSVGLGATARHPFVVREVL